MPVPPLPDLFGEGPYSDADVEAFIDRVLDTAENSAVDAIDITEEIGEETFFIQEVVSPPGVEPRKQPWAIHDVGEAEWAMKRYAEAQAELEEVDRRVEEAQARLRDYARSASRRALVAKSFFGGHLERFALERRAKDDKLATLVLPSGRVSTTRHKPKPEVVAEVPLAHWLEDLGRFDAVRYSVLSSQLNFVLREVTDLWVSVDLSCGHSQRWLKVATLWDDLKPEDMEDPDHYLRLSADQRSGKIAERIDVSRATAEGADWTCEQCALEQDLDAWPAVELVASAIVDEKRLAVVDPPTGTEPPGMAIAEERLTARPKPT